MYNKTAYGLGANSCYIRELAAWGQARAAQIGKENVYDFSIGNPSIPTPTEVDETIRQILTDTPSIAVHGYTSAIGLHKTRKAIADDLNSRYGQTITPEELFIGCGTSQELCAVFLALSAPGGKVLAIAPYFGEYIPFVENAGMELDIVSADVPGFQINFTALEEMLTPNTQALILNSPNNPSGTVWLVPCTYSRVSSPFGYRWHPTTGEYSMHKGVDLAAPKGTPIYATRSGYVNVATYHSTAGNYVTINHRDGYTSVYMHMTHYVVSPGQSVAAGQLIGYVGSTGRSTGPHLHFGIHYNGTYVNPMDYIG